MGNAPPEHEGPPWEFRIHLWEKSDDACADREGGHTGDTTVDEGFSWQDGDRLDVLNDILYETRGVKSGWELAWVDYIRPATESPKDANTSADD